MTNIDSSALETAIRSLSARFKGPGGVVGVVKDGVVIHRHAWGYADLEARVPMTTGTLVPICSISKHVTCAVLLDLFDEPSVLDGRIADHLPNLKGKRPTVADLCNNQSGLRDYWALTVLNGAALDGVFREEDVRPLLARMGTTHFEPGSQYSYSNGNFRILRDLIEDASGRTLGELYRERIFDPAGMQTAVLAGDTSMPLNGVIGYEGNDDVGLFPATNRIFWDGDAGIAATLDDMVAWECFIDRTRDDEGSLYNRLSVPQCFADGTPSLYGNGLARESVGGIAVTGHGGALRGFRCRRLHAASERLSVVVMFNHEADAHAAALAVMKAALGHRDDEPPRVRPHPGWSGDYLEPTTGLLLRVKVRKDRLDTNFGGRPEKLMLGPDGIARSPPMILERVGDTLRLERPGDNLRSTATKISGEARNDIEGRFSARELEASLHVVAAGNAFYAGFEGLLGKGPMHALYPVGEDIWILPCLRSMDAPAPGDWTVRVRRDAVGKVSGLTLGCWLARNVEYTKAG